MATIENVSRRDFIKTTGTTGALVLGANFAPLSFVSQVQAAEGSATPNLFVAIAPDGEVTITSIRVEMGQGVRTGIPMILADELEADWERIKLWQAPGDETKYDPAGQDAQNTDGSRSTRHHFDIMREIGANARDVLIKAAAQKWGVDESTVYAKNQSMLQLRSKCPWAKMHRSLN